MPSDLARQLGELEKRVARMEYRESHLISLARKGPFWHLSGFVLENDLNAEQIQGICDVMESFHKSLEKGEPVEASQFEECLRPHIPEKQKPGGHCYPFIQCLLITFTMTGQWDDVCNRFRSDFNVPSEDRLMGD